MTRPAGIEGASPQNFSDDAWIEVLSAVDRTYADLVDYQERLEQQNAQLQEMRTFLTSILASVSDVLIVVDRVGQIEQVSHSMARLTGQGEAALVGQGWPGCSTRPAIAASPKCCTASATASNPKCWRPGC